MLTKLSLRMKILAGLSLISFLGMAALTLRLKSALQPEKLRTLFISTAQKSLKRQVHLKEVSVSLLKGLSLSGLEVSEHPDFSAGTFASVDSFYLKIQWKPLLRKKVVVDSIAIENLSVQVIRGKDGTFNFADLTQLESKTSAATPKRPEDAPSELPFELDIKSASLSESRLSYRDIAAGREWQVSDLEAAAENVSLSQPFPVRAGLKAVQTGAAQPLSASLTFAGGLDLSSAGTVSAQIVKLSAQARGFKADAAGNVVKAPSGELSADFDSLTLKGPGVNLSAAVKARVQGETTTVSLKRFSTDLAGLKVELSGNIKTDSRNISFSDIKGRVGAGTLKAALAVNDYAKAPKVDLQAELGELDAGKLLAALQKLKADDLTEQKRPAEHEQPKKNAQPASIPMKAKGTITISRLNYAQSSASNLKLNWDLIGITPDFRSLSGWAKLAVGPGKFNQESSARSGFAKALLVPLTLLKSLGNLGGHLKLIPDFSKINFTEIIGDYSFEKGVMTLKDFHMLADAANVKTLGTIDLPNQALSLKAVIRVAALAPLEVDIGGTFDNPKPRVRLEKLLVKPIEKLAEPALKLLKGFFQK